MRSRRALTDNLWYFRTEALKLDWKESSNTSLQLWIWYDTDLLEIKTEANVVSLRDFVGSVGGSLGLFLGFSLFTYLSLFLDTLFQRINA